MKKFHILEGFKNFPNIHKVALQNSVRYDGLFKA